MSTRHIGIKLFTIVFLILSFILVGFTETNTDNLYHYQWGLKNNGNFLVDKGILADNFQVEFYDKQTNDKYFKDSKEIVDYLKLSEYDSGISYATENIDINWENGYKFFKEKKPVRDAVVAIIDSGVDINHFELSGNIWKNEKEYPNGFDDDRNGYVDDINGYNFIDKSGKVFKDAVTDLHGTHSAGTIVARHDNGGIKGIAYDPHIKIMSLKVLGENGKGPVPALVEAINYAKNNGANICNISLGLYNYDKLLDDAIKNAPDMLFVVAAGNGGNFIGYNLDEKDVYPAKLPYDNVVTVGNLSFDGTRYESSNYGSPVDVFAPGTMILSTIPNNNFGYITGTSMSAPFVTATCAMLYSLYPDIHISKYKSILVNGATRIPTLDGMAKSSGMLNIYNTLALGETFK